MGPVYYGSNVILIPAASAIERVQAAGRAIGHLIEQTQPDAILLEIPDFIGDRVNAQNLITFFLAAGAAVYVASASGRRIHAHRSSANQRNRAKDLYKAKFREMIGRPPLRDDESDAFCFGISFLEAARQHGGVPPGY